MYKFLARKLTGDYGMKTYLLYFMDTKVYIEVLPKKRRHVFGQF
jgi:hypothetical protein